MSALTFALNEIKMRIPIEVLNVAFKTDITDWRQAPISLDDRIMNQVIRQRVLTAANVVGGQMAVIPLDGLQVEYLDNYNMIYRVPKERTQNRSIVSVLSVGYLPYINGYGGSSMGFGGLAPSSITEVSNTAMRVMDSVSGIPPISNAQIELLGENTVLIRDQFRTTQAYFLRCILENDENLNNISPRSWPAFADLCELAVKSYIYKTLIIKIDQGFLVGGQELGAMKAYVEECRDSEEQYRTHLKEVWRKVAFMNDQQSHQRHIRLMISPAV